MKLPRNSIRQRQKARQRAGFSAGAIGSSIQRRPIFELLEDRRLLSLTPDRFEPNETSALAADIGIAPGAHVGQLTVHDATDNDWYRFEVLRPDQLQFNLQFVAASGDLSFDLLPSGSSVPIASSSPTASGAKIDPLNLAVGVYTLHVVGVGGDTNDYALDIGAGPNSSIRIFYVNDESTNNDFYATAVGNNANDGLSAATPKASVQAVLDGDMIGPNDLILIDTGTYDGSTSITSDDEGATYVGSPGGSSLSSGGTALQLIDADFNLFYRLAFTGSGSGIYASAASGNFSTNNRFLKNTFNVSSTAIQIDGGFADLIEDNEITGSLYGMRILDGDEIRVRGNQIAGAIYGLSIESGASVTAEDNDVQAVNFAVYSSTSTATLTNNDLHGAQYGIYQNNATLTATGNRIYENATGILSPIYSYAVVHGNAIVNNGIGVEGIGEFGGIDWTIAAPNVINDNDIGIIPYAGTAVSFNRIHDNEVGIMPNSNVDIHHNVLYGNTDGILVSAVNDIDIYSNTIHAPAGDGIVVQQNSSDVRLRNNIIWADGGYALYVATNSQQGFASDYNNLYKTGSGPLIWWQKPFYDLFDWQVEADFDGHSIGYTALEPNRDNPTFATGNDYYQLAPTSTSIDSGDPADPFSQEPGDNGGRIDLGAYGNTGGAAQSPSQYLRIDYPEYYNDWPADEGRPILWHTYDAGTFNHKLTGLVTITLHKEGVGQIRQIAQVPAADGVYSGWSPSVDGIAGSVDNRYWIQISSDLGPTDSSREKFSIPTTSGNYYVNDGSTANDDYPTAAGSNRNTGKTAGDPKANLLPLVRSYKLQPGDTVQIETGDYIQVRNVVLSNSPGFGDDEGFTVTGPTIPGHVATLNRANPHAGSTNIEINDGDFITLENLTLTGANMGLWVHNGSTNFHGQHLTVSNNTMDGIRIEADAIGSDVDDLTAFSNGGTGIYIATPINSLSNSVAYSNATGIELANTGGTLVENNEIYNNATGLSVYNSLSSQTIIGNANLGLTLGNHIHDNSHQGVSAQGNVSVVGNSIYGHSGSGDLGLYLGSGAQARNNVVFNNYAGIIGGQGPQDTVVVENNRVFGNESDGVDVGRGSSVRGNVVYANNVGIRGHQSDYNYYSYNGTIEDNIIYQNVTSGITINRGTTVSVTNNTVYQLTGNAITVDTNSTGVSLVNNILWTLDGFDISVASNSQSNFYSDFNVLYTGGTGQVASWQGIARPLLSDWQNTIFQDQNSLSQNPEFVVDVATNQLGYDVATGTDYSADDDFHLQSLHGSFHQGALAPVYNIATMLPTMPTGSWQTDAIQSPAIDRGRDADSYANEPADNGGYINIGAYGNTDQASKSPPEYVLVTRPDGGEVWPAEQSFAVRWRSHNFVGNVDIELMQNDSVVYVIADDTTNDGEYLWAIPDNPGTIPAASNYRIRITRSDNGALVDHSNQNFEIREPVAIYYVNDDDTTGDVYTTAVGSDSNSGLDEDHPKRSIAAILAAYTLTGNAQIRVDTGTYSLDGNIVVSASDNNFEILGPLSRMAVLDRGNTSSGSYVFEITGGDSVRLTNLTITGGEYGVYAGGWDSDGLTILNSRIYENTSGNIYLADSNDNAVISNSVIHDSAYGISSQGQDTEIIGNQIYDHSAGVQILGARGQVTYNNIYNNFTGVSASYPGASASGIHVTDNDVHHNSATGIEAFYQVIIADNAVWGHDAATGIGIHLSAGATARSNEVFDNASGIEHSYYGYNGSVSILENRVYHNSLVGITARVDSLVQGNVVHTNPIGILGTTTVYTQPYTGTIANNLLYANSDRAIVLRRGYGSELINNTVVQEGGDALLVEDSSANVSLRNNIVAADGGYGIYVANDSQVGFVSDYNALYTTNGGRIGRWADLDFTSLVDWRYELGLDEHSHVGDPKWSGAANIAAYAPGTPGAVQIVDNGDAGFSKTTNWSSTGNGYQTDSDESLVSYAAADEVATWTFSGLDPSSWYAISATWPTDFDLTYDARFTVFDGNADLRERIINQTVAPDDFSDAGATWERLGTYYIRGNTLSVQLSNFTAYSYGNLTFAAADAVRIQKLSSFGGVSESDFNVLSTSPTIDAGDPRDMTLSEPAPNGGRINQGHTGNTVDAATSPSQLVQVLSPNGLEKLEEGQSINIQWHSAGLATDQVAALINVGGQQVGNWNHEVFQTEGYSNGSVGSSIDRSGVVEPAPEAVYQSYAYSGSQLGDQVAFHLPAANGSYSLRLHFIEPYYYYAGTRQFDVVLQGNTVATDFDIIAAAGAPSVATTLTYPVTASAGQGIDLRLINKIYGTQAVLAGIELLLSNPSGVPAPTADVELSIDGGANWTAIASSVAMDHLGQGDYAWTTSLQTDDALIRIRANQGSMPTGQSDQSFSIANADRYYYVNDGAATSDEFTTDVGHNANSGKSPNEPMASLAALIRAYDLDANDLVRVDAGRYILPRNIVLDESDSGAIIQGSLNANSILDRGNTSPGSHVIDLAGADDLIIDQLHVTGGEYGIYADSTASSDNIQILHSHVYNNLSSNIYIGSSNDGVRIANNEISGAYTGVNVQAARTRVTSNNVFNNLVGIQASFVGADVDYILINENQVHHNSSRGISADYKVQVEDNAVWGHVATSAVGIELLRTATADGNSVFDNDFGIFQPNGIFQTVTVVNNRVFHNTQTGITARNGSLVQDNVVHSNSIGIAGVEDYTYYYLPFTGTIQNNLVYANTNEGIRLSYSSGGRVINNTVDQPIGDAVLVENNSSNVIVTNNVLSVADGYDIYVANNSQLGFNSDYNDLYTKVDGKIGYWQRDFLQLDDWRYELGLDQHSHSTDPEWIDGASPGTYAPTAPVGAPLIIDDGDSGFTANGNWTVETSGYQSDFHQASTLYINTDATARWTFTNLDPNSWYEVSVTWPAASQLSYDARFAVLEGNARLQQISLAQNSAPNDFTTGGTTWERLGTYYIQGNSLSVELANFTAYNYGQPMFVAADAARLQKIAGFSGVPDAAFDVQPTSKTIDAGDPDDMVLSEPSPNGGRINQGHAGNTPNAVGSPAQLVQVLSPNGLEKLEQSQSTSIQWRSAGLASHSVAALINVGGATVDNWHADRFQLTAASALAINNPIDVAGVTEPAPDGVYQSFVFSDSQVGSHLDWHLPAADGTYTLRLHFMEPSYISVGSRQFDVVLQGATVTNDYDILAAAGAMFTATTLSYTVTASGGQGIDLELVNKMDGNGALLSGIELLANNLSGIPAPSADIELSTDGGTNWMSIANAVAMDHLGRGAFQWNAAPLAASAIIRVRANQGTQPIDQSDKSFSIVDNGADYYVSTTGSNANSGKSLSQPMASLGALVRAYDLDEDDVVHMGVGDYAVLRNIVLDESDSSFEIRGSGAELNRGNTSSGSYVIELAGADAVSLAQLRITGGEVGIFAASAADSDGLWITESTIHDNTSANIYVNDSNDALTISGNDIYGAATGLYINGNGVFVSENQIHGHATGVTATGASAYINFNEIYNNSTGIYAARGGSPDERIVIGSNKVHHNTSRGISASQNVLISGNDVWSQGNAGAIGIELTGAVATANDVFANDQGIVTSQGYPYAGTTVANNRVFNNATTGITARYGTTVDGNVVYSNSVGIHAAYDYYYGWFSGTITNNLVYANNNQGIQLIGANNGLVLNNTVYQQVGNAVLVESSYNIDVRNNILWIEAGYDVYVDSASSQAGFTSDYNVLYSGNDPNAHLGYFNDTIFDCLSASPACTTPWNSHGLDGHSKDVNPNFVDFDGADNTLGYSTLGAGYDGGLDDNFYQVRFSVAIDSADGTAAPATDILNLPRVDDVGVPDTGTGIGYADIGAYEFRGNSNDQTPPQVLDTTPAFIEDAGTSGLITTSIAVFFSEELNVIDANAIANYELRRSVNGTFGDFDDIILAIVPAYEYVAGTGQSKTTLDLGLSGAALPGDTYRLTVRGANGSFIHDTAGNRLDGNRDGDADFADDYVRTFVIKTPGIVVTPTSGLSTAEAGETANFTIVLNTQPTADVTIALAIDPVNGRMEGQLSTSSLTFSAASWDLPQTVTVTGLDDFVDDGNVAYSVTTAAATSSDSNYQGLDAVDVALTNTDDDTAGITVTPTSGPTTTEAAGTATFTVVLDSQPTADVSIAISSSDLTEGTVSSPSLTFTAANWYTPQQITVTGVDDAIDDDNVAYTIVLGAASSTDGLYNGLQPSNVLVTNNDDDTAGFIFNRTSGLATTESGGADTFTLRLATEPLANVTVLLSSSDTTEGTVSPSSVTFTTSNWNTPQTVTATGVDDGLSDSDIAFSIVTAAATSSDGKYNGLDPSDVSVLNLDNEAANVDIRMLAVTTNLATLTLQYEVLLATAGVFEIGLYRSSDLLAGSDTLVSAVVISSAGDRTVGIHTKNYTIGTTAGQVGLPGAHSTIPDTADDYYLLAVADHLNVINEVDDDALNEDNTAVFTGTYHVSGQPLMIHGGAGNDAITLQISGSSQKLTFNGQTTSITATTVPQARIRGHVGNDAITGTIAAMPLFIWGGDGNDSITGGAADDMFTGGAGNDTIIGNAGSDTHVYDADLVLGADTLKESTGSDTLDFSATSAAITVNLSLATMQVVNPNVSINLQSATTFENIIGGTSSDTLVGNTLANRLDSGAGADSLAGGTGNDTLIGGSGNDTAVGGAGDDLYLFDADTSIGADTLDESGGGVDTLNFADTNAPITVNLAAATVQVVNANVSLNLKSGSTFENIVGGSGSDTLTGNALANRLEGGGGNDSLTGSAGNDTYVFDADNDLGTDSLTEASNAGTDVLNFSATSSDVSVDLGFAEPQGINSNLTLHLQSASVFENLLGGSGNDTLRGNSLANVITGGVGNDLLIGGAGNDSYPFDADTSSGTDTIDEAGGGTDILDFVTTTTIAISVNVGITSTQIVNSNLSLILVSGAEIEKVTGGSLADVLVGNALANTLSGGPGDDSIAAGGGNDTLVGAAGNDTLAGGAGDDIYQFDGDLATGVDSVNESEGGIDTFDFVATTTKAIGINLGTGGAQVVNANLSLLLVADEVENVVGGSNGDRITGNTLNNNLSGGSGNDTIVGGTGDDSLTGAAGDDSLIGGSGDDTYLFDADSLIGTDQVDESGGGADWLNFYATTGKAVTIDLNSTAQQNVNLNLKLQLLTASVEHVVGGSLGDTLIGNTADNLLFGGKGNDTLIGGEGRDLILGGTGVDSILGGLAQDILIGATTNYFSEANGNLNRAALNAVMAEWTRPPVDPNPSLDYAARILNLKNGGGLNGSTVLNTSVVSNDGTTIDRIFGNEDLDWLWKSSTDVLGDEDLGGDETVQTL